MIHLEENKTLIKKIKKIILCKTMLLGSLQYV